MARMQELSDARMMHVEGGGLFSWIWNRFVVKRIIQPVMNWFQFLA